MIYITGDLHGELERFNAKNIKKLKRGDTLIVCGDFGFIWNQSLQEKKALNKLKKKRFTILFIDGKHENFDLLETYPVVKWNNGLAHKISNNIYHLMRGEIFEIENKRILTFGGGESPDKEYRVSAGTWWERELPSVEEIKRCLSNLKEAHKEVDYVITHEPPLNVKNKIDRKFDSVNTLEGFFKNLEKKITFQKWFFGCVHLDKEVTPRHTAVFFNVVPIEVPVKKGLFKKK